MNWPESLVEDIARRRAVLFLGAGVSMNAVGKDGQRPPSWTAFLNACLARCDGDTDHIELLIESGDLLSACELLKDRLHDEWAAILTEYFADPQFEPAAIHAHLFRLDVGIVVTQNFDKIYDVYAQNETHGSTKVKNYYDDDIAFLVRRNYRAIVKALGTIDEPSKMVFTRKEYAVLRSSYRSFSLLLDALFLTHTFLFVGCSLNDPDLRLFLEQHAYAHPSSPPHFMTIPEGALHPEVAASVGRNMNIRLVPYDAGGGHDELEAGIEELAELVEAKRVEIADNQDW